MRIYIGRGVYVDHGNFVIPEIRKNKLNDGIKFTENNNENI